MSRLYIPTTTAQTQSAGDNSTLLATDAFVTTAVSNAIAGVNPAVAVQAATAAVLPNSPTYANGVAGVGATLTTVTLNTALVVDGYTPILNDRILVKNQTSAFQNGVYSVSQLAGVGLAWVLTRALDYDAPTDMNNTGAIPVVNGTANIDTSWVQTSTVNTVGTDAVTFTQFTLNPTTIMTTTTYDAAAIGQQIVGTTAPQTVSGKILSDAFIGSSFQSQSATAESLILTASTDFIYSNLLELGATKILEIPATSSLEIESYIDQPYFNNMLRTAPNASNTFISQSATTQNITLPASTDFIAVGLFEIGAGNNLEIPSTSTLAIEPTPAANFAAGANQAAVLTSEASALQTYGDNLTTVGPSVTVNIGPLGIVLVVLYAYALNNGVNGETFTSFVVSGANTQAAADNYAMFYQAYANNAETQAGTTFLLTGLLPGSTTFKMQYRVTANTGTWKNRRIAVVPLG